MLDGFGVFQHVVIRFHFLPQFLVLLLLLIIFRAVLIKFLLNLNDPLKHIFSAAVRFTIGF